jgi:hypothetical protein
MTLILNLGRVSGNLLTAIEHLAELTFLAKAYRNLLPDIDARAVKLG